MRMNSTKPGMPGIALACLMGLHAPLPLTQPSPHNFFLGVSGQVWNDGNGNALKEETYMGYNGPALYVALYQPSVSTNVIAFATVVIGTDGSYDITSGFSASSGDYTLRLVAAQPVIGQPVPPVFPTGAYVITGENVDGVTEFPGDGEIDFTAGTTNLVNYDFGINNIPSAYPVSLTNIPNSEFNDLALAGYQGIAMTTLPPLQADDIEDCGVCIGGAGVAEFLITDIFPNTRIFFEGNEISAGFPLPLTFDYSDLVIYGALGSGAAGNEIGFEYLMIDHSSFTGVPADYKLSSMTALPVDLTSFEVKRENNSALLKWTTAQEFNNNRFEIERSIDGTNFSKIAEVAATNTASPRSYTHIDNNIQQLSSKRLYYRLKQVDNDARHEYSQIRVLKLEHASPLAVHPMPFINTLTIELPGSALFTGNTDISFIDMSGKTVYKRRINITDPSRNIFLSDLTTLPTGSYILSVRNETDAKYLKIIKN